MVDILRSRNGIATEVIVDSGQRLLVLSIAWGSDDGESTAHTTNISPSADGHSVDFFLTTHVVRIFDPADGTCLFDT